MGINLRYSPLEWNSQAKRFEVNGAVIGLDTMTPAPPIAATAGFYRSSIVRSGNIIKTSIAIDLTGLASITTNGDIIGATGLSHIGQITTAKNGIIVAGQVGCAIVPTTGDDDIDIYAATEGTGALDGAIGDLVETALVASAGAYAIGTVKPFTTLPAANKYLYLTTGDTTAGTYDAGTIFIEMWGTVA